MELVVWGDIKELAAFLVGGVVSIYFGIEK